MLIPSATNQHSLDLLADEADAHAISEFHAAYSTGREFLVPEAILRASWPGSHQ